MSIPPFGSAPYSVKVDTKNNILAKTPNSKQIYFSSDTFEVYVSNNVSWYTCPFRYVIEPTAPDIGYPAVSSKIGIGADYITDKLIANSRIGNNANTANGSIRSTTSVGLQVYYNNKWNDVVIGFRFLEDPNDGYELQHKPIGFLNWIEIVSGNSTLLGLNGKPIIQGYSASIGAYPVDPIISGGSF